MHRAAMKNPRTTESSLCPCGSGAGYADCCAPLHQGTPAQNAEQLMRSRYTAYVLGLTDYLRDTWYSETRPATLDLAAEPRPNWLGLKVIGQRQIDADHAEVEFVARYKINGKAYRMQETSRFIRDQGKWVYVDGDVEE